MTRSLRARLLLTASVAALSTVLVTGVAVQGLFERHTERELLTLLDADLRFLARGLAAGGGVAAQPLPDARFLEPYSGLYWQVRREATGVRLRSPSLGGFTLPLPDTPPAGGALRRTIAIGPEGSKLIVLERLIPGETGGEAFRVAAAVDRKIAAAADRAFMLELMPVLASIALGLLAAAAVQAHVALRPIRRARQAVAEHRAGRRDRLAGALPTELDQLATDFDAVIAAQRRAAVLARERAADLAHGLRTPLALLAVRARELRERGEVEAATEIAAVTASIEHRTTRELARAAIRGPSAAAAPLPLAPLVGRVAGALARGADPGIIWEVEVPEDLAMAADEANLTELLGSLMDNARKWARGRIRVSASRAPALSMVTVEDDGPGVPPQERRAVVLRGARLDPVRSGNGLGLSIADDIAASYGGTLRLDESPLGGLLVRLSLPDRR